MKKATISLVAAFLMLFSIQTPPLVAQDSSLLKPDVGNSARPLVFVITGESNSGGNGLNADATAEERKPRASVQIMNLTDRNFGFETMQLGVNNLRDHYRLENYYEVYHGLELGLANAVDAGAFAGRSPVYLIKTGHGGSRISQWTEGNKTDFWKKFVERIDAAKHQLSTEPAPQWVVWFSLGINDAIDGAPIESWKEGVRAHIAKMKKQLPGAVIVMTQFQAMGYPEINEALAEIAGEDAGVVAVNSSDTTLRDKNHWDYAGLKTMATRMSEATNELLAETRASKKSSAKQEK